MKIAKILFFLVLLEISSQAKNISQLSNNYLLRVGLGNTFDFETKINNKGTGLPTEAMLKYGFEYGYGFKNNLYVGAALDWNIIYPRNFDFQDKQLNFFRPPISLWYVPVTDVKVGYIFNDQYKLTIGLAYYWGLTTSFSYQATELVFFEISSLIWMDRIFNTGGFYGGGFDNLFLTASLGFKF